MRTGAWCLRVVGNTCNDVWEGWKQNVQVCKSVWEVGRGKSTKRQSGKRVHILGGGGPRQGRR